MMSSWNKRPIEVAHLLNPAFCSVILRESILGYKEETNTGMPYVLSFLVLPLVLHKSTRDILPISISTKLHSWVHKNQYVRVGLDKRAQHLGLYTREAIIFSIRLEIIHISENGQLNVSQKKCKRLELPSSSEPVICQKKAYFVGRWFARTGDPAIIFAMLGVKP
jgi:hypothetical protein